MNLKSDSPRHLANLGKEYFDMPYTSKFTSSVGQLLPVLYDFLLAGDHVKVSEEMFTRTQPLNTSAFVDIRENIDYFFVPMTQIFSMYPQWKFGVGVPVSNVFDPQSILPDGAFPTLHGSDVIAVVKEINAPSGQYPYPFGGSPGYTNVFEKSRTFGSIRLLNHLGYGFNTNPSESQDPRPFLDVRVNPSMLCAYQKIFFDYYCLDERTPIDNIAFNLDAWYSEYSDSGTGTHHAVDFQSAFFHMAELRYVPWKKDYFTGMYVNPVESSSSLNTAYYGANLQQITDYISAASPEARPRTVVSSITPDSGSNPNTQVGYPTVTNANISNINNNLSSRLTTGSIRKMFALEKLLSITKRANDDYASQVAAHFGYKMSEALSNKVMYIGGTSSRLVINEVVGTVNNENTSLGEIAGKGVAYKPSKGSTVDFTAPCDGIIMGIYYARPELDYRANGLDRLNAWIRPSDLYTPEYANLGLQPVFGYELDYYLNGDDEFSPYSVLGWQYRYSEFKTKVNKVYTGFMEEGLSDWTIGKFMESSSFAGNSKDFYCDPSSLDSVMLVSYKGGQIPVADWSFQYDPLLHYFSFDYKKSSIMDAFGLPKL